MKKRIATILKILIPLGLGAFIIWFYWDKLTEDEREQLFKAFGDADYFWIVVSISLTLLSHYSRAWRWNYLLEPLGHRGKPRTNFFALMTGYMINMAVPRAGEAARAGYLSRAEKIPFSQTFGTIAAERVVDLVILLAITGLTFFLQFGVLGDYYNDIVDSMSAKLTTKNIIILCCAGLGLIGFVVFLIKKTSIGGKVKAFVKGLWDGLRSIFTMKKKWLFLAHTVFVWVAYLLMFYVCFWSFDATADAPVGAVFAGFVLGSFAVVIVPGGIGAYPAAIATAIALYLPEAKVDAFALGWIIWGSQTALNLILGGLGIMLAPTTSKVADEEAMKS